MAEVKVTGAFARAAAERLDPALIKSSAAQAARRMKEALGELRDPGSIGRGRIATYARDAAAELDTSANGEAREHLAKRGLPGAIDMRAYVPGPNPRYAAQRADREGRVIATYGDQGSSRSNGGLGGLLVVRPTQQELELGATPSDIILVGAGATASPFASSGMTTYGLGGGEIPSMRVSTEPIVEEDAAPLYGDAGAVSADMVNKLVSGAGQFGKSVLSSDFWKNLSPQTKMVLAGLGTYLGLKTVGKVATPLAMFRLGKSSNASGTDSGSGGEEQYAITPATSLVSKSLVDGAGPITPEGEALALGKRWFPVSNSFFAGAYAIGREYGERSTQPNFGLLSSDPMLAAKAMRGLRAPKLWVHSGRIIRSSAPYTQFIGSDALRRKMRLALERDPLAGGLWSSIATTGLSALKEIGSAVFGKIKEWISGFIGRLKAFFNRVFGPKTHVVGRWFSDAITPTYMAARFWQLVGKLPESTLSKWEDEIKEEVARLCKMKDQDPDTFAEADAEVKRLRAEMEQARVNAGVPSDLSWTDGPLPSEGETRVHALSSVLKQYSPKVAQHVKSLCEQSAWNVHKALGSYNPPIMFADQEALEEDVRKAMRDIQSELDLRGASQAQVAPTNVVSAGSTGVATTAGPASQTGQVNNTPGIAAIGTTTMVSDPETLAKIVALNKSGSVASVPRAWVAQLPSSVQQAYYGVTPETDSPELLVGDAGAPGIRTCIKHRAPWSRRPSRYSRDRVMPAGTPLEGDALAGNPAIVAAAKFFCTWVLPSLIMLIPWNRVGDWTKKNNVKAGILRKASSGNAAKLKATAAASGGFLGALSGALKWLGRKGGRLAHVVFRFASSHPKLAVISAILACCFAMGSSYSGSTSEWGEFVSMLRRALQDALNAGYITEDEWRLHDEALQAVAGSPTLTEAEAQEVQTCVIVCTMCIASLAEGGDAALGAYPGLAELSEALKRVSDKSKDGLNLQDHDDLEAVAEQLVSEYALEETSDHASGSSAAAPSAAASGLPAGAGEAIAAAGGALVAGNTPSSGSAAEAVGVSAGEVEPTGSQQTAVPGMTQSGGQSQSIPDLTEDQMSELAALTDAAQSMTDNDLELESSGATSRVSDNVKALLSKWGLPLGMAAAITALVLSAVRARRTGSTTGVGGTINKWWDAASRWWQEVTAKADPSANLNGGGDKFTAVAL